MKDTLTLVCAKHATMLDVSKQKVPGRVDVLPCRFCLEEAYQKGQEEYKKRFVLGG